MDCKWRDILSKNNFFLRICLWQIDKLCLFIFPAIYYSNQRSSHRNGNYNFTEIIVGFLNDKKKTKVSKTSNLKNTGIAIDEGMDNFSCVFPWLVSILVSFSVTKSPDFEKVLSVWRNHRWFLRFLLFKHSIFWSQCIFFKMVYIRS